MCRLFIEMVKKKLSHYTHGQALKGFQEVETLRISRKSAHESGKVVSLTHQLALPRRT
jgi:hypothetical protein